jgi:proteasome lid subunit RPN8/RPN11
VCGLIAADTNESISLIFLKNRSNQPGHFKLDPEELERARRRVRTARKRPIGTFHSHPVSEAVPGRGDMRNLSASTVLLIYDVCGINARLWRIVRRGRTKIAVELPLVIQRSLR